MDYQSIITTGRDNIATATLNRPDNMNTFTTLVATELDHVFRLFDNEDAVRVRILKGAGKVFCGGIDVSEFPG